MPYAHTTPDDYYHVNNGGSYHQHYNDDFFDHVNDVKHINDCAPDDSARIHHEHLIAALNDVEFYDLLDRAIEYYNHYDVS